MVSAFYVVIPQYRNPGIKTATLGKIVSMPRLPRIE
jgi:hypothetical protein